MKNTKAKEITEQLRQAIKAAEKRGQTRYQIAKAAKMPESMVHRIADGETIPRLDTASRITAAIGLRFSLTTC